MVEILPGHAACFRSSTMANCIIPAPPMDTKRNGAQQQTISPKIKSGDFVLISSVRECGQGFGLATLG